MSTAVALGHAGSLAAPLLAGPPHTPVLQRSALSATWSPQQQSDRQELLGLESKYEKVLRELEKIKLKVKAKAFNGQVKQRFFRHTQRGGHQGAGHAHGGGQVGKKIDGLSRWLLRRWYWTSGKARTALEAFRNRDKGVPGRKRNHADANEQPVGDFADELEFDSAADDRRADL